jgi:CheY-like chemotaxis protein
MHTVETVLAVDDEPIVRMLIVDQLTKAGYGILQAATFAEVVERVERYEAHHPNEPLSKVIMDWRFPVGSAQKGPGPVQKNTLQKDKSEKIGGEKSVQYIRKKYPNMPIYIVTGSSLRDVWLACAAIVNNMEKVEIIPKPIADDFIERIRAAGVHEVSMSGTQRGPEKAKNDNFPFARPA